MAVRERENTRAAPCTLDVIDWDKWTFAVVARKCGSEAVREATDSAL